MTTLGKTPGPTRGRTYLFTQLKVYPKFGSPQSLFAPLAINEHEEDESVLPYAVARVRRGARVGLMYDADADPRFGATLAAQMKAGSILASRDGTRLEFHGSGQLESVAVETLDSARLGGDQSNSTLLLGEEAVIKIYRRLQSGPTRRSR